MLTGWWKRTEYDVIKGQYGNRCVALPWKFGMYLVGEHPGRVKKEAWTSSRATTSQVFMPMRYLYLTSLWDTHGMRLVPSPEYVQEYDAAFSSLLEDYIAWCLTQ